ncbi:Rhodanese-like domain-containing protein [Trichoderma afarasin]
MSKHIPPPGARSINEILAEARTHLTRITPAQLLTELQSSSSHGPTHIVDIRPAAQREREGALIFPDAPLFDASTTKHTINIIERNVLEWRLDPQNEARIKEIVDEFGYDTRVVVSCSEGYTSSLAARELQKLGLSRATDLEGGYWAWKQYLDARQAEPLN